MLVSVIESYHSIRIVSTLSAVSPAELFLQCLISTLSKSAVSQLEQLLPYSNQYLCSLCNDMIHVNRQSIHWLVDFQIGSQGILSKKILGGCESTGDNGSKIKIE